MLKGVRFENFQQPSKKLEAGIRMPDFELQTEKESLEFTKRPEGSVAWPISRQNEQKKWVVKWMGIRTSSLSLSKKSESRSAE